MHSLIRSSSYLCLFTDLSCDAVLALLSLLWIVAGKAFVGRCLLSGTCVRNLCHEPAAGTCCQQIPETTGGNFRRKASCCSSLFAVRCSILPMRLRSCFLFLIQRNRGAFFSQSLRRGCFAAKKRPRSLLQTFVKGFFIVKTKVLSGFVLIFFFILI